MNKQNLLIFSGPAGAGKSSILRELFKRLDNLYFSVSVTTRPPRDGEIDGVHYNFITLEQFNEMRANDELLEYDGHFQNWYGTPRKPIETKLSAGYDVILDIETNGAKQVLAKMPDAVSVFIFPPSFEILEQRLRDRKTESDEQILLRLAKAKEEFAERNAYKYFVVNDNLMTAVVDCEQIILSERGKLC